MSTTSREARFLMRMVRMMLAGCVALVVGILLDTPSD